MSRRVAGALLALASSAACSFQVRLAGDDALDPDGPGGDGADGCASFATYVDTCALPPGLPLVLSDKVVFDTDRGTLSDASGPLPIVEVVVDTPEGELAVIVATSVTIAGNAVFGGVGTRPMAVVSTGDVVIGSNALVFVGSGGAGARAACEGGATAGADHNGGAGGGGGGGFGAPGGRGGRGNSDGTNASGGAAGAAVATLPAAPRGGCPGGPGGRSANPGGAGGAAGGAIYLVSATQILLVEGAGIDAGGAGGGGGARTSGDGDAGGGGGGSGGMIVLEAPRIRSNGILAANGGGGGEGSGNGNAGQAGTTALLGVDAATGGGGLSPSGTDGGDGGCRAATAGAAVEAIDRGGGGGGGGGVGIVRVLSPDATMGAQVSPEQR